VRLHWLVQEGHPRLLLFFNGWGMDERLLAMIAPPAGRDLLAVDDYTDLQDADAVRTAVSRYPAADLVAWSMGVWAAATVFGSAEARFGKAVAVNGTGRPIDDEYGIPAGLFRATVDNFSERTRDSFFRRMCDGRDACGEFLPHAPLRDVEDQRRELLALSRDAGEGVPPPGPFTSAVIGARDRIMPPESQCRYWQGVVPCRTANLPHLPFSRRSGWREILGETDEP
jgi:pimeloyl-[acyl-carrier protein] methyl ester esterase